MKQLSKKQKEQIANLYKSGKTRKEIAEMMGISPSTVQRHTTTRSTERKAQKFIEEWNRLRQEINPAAGMEDWVPVKEDLPQIDPLYENVSIEVRAKLRSGRVIDAFCRVDTLDWYSATTCGRLTSPVVAWQSRKEECV